MARNDSVFGSGMRGGPWGSFVALGICLVLLGVVASANLMVATVATAYYVGIMVLIGGALQVAHAMRVRQSGPAVLWFLAGLLYLFAGIGIFLDPLFAAMVFTLFLSLSLCLSGVFRAAIALSQRGRGWGWTLASGLASIAAALVIGMGWPVNAVWVLGLVLSIDLMFQGFAVLFVGLAMRSATVRG